MEQMTKYDSPIQGEQDEQRTPDDISNKGYAVMELAEDEGDEDTQPFIGPPVHHALIPAISNSPSDEEEESEFITKEKSLVSMENGSSRVEWIDEVVVPRWKRCYMETSHVERQWKGADWSLLLKANYSFGVVRELPQGVYLGYDHPDKLPDNWSCNIRYTITLLDENDQLMPTSCYSSTDMFYGSNKRERYDRGPSFFPFPDNFRSRWYGRDKQAFRFKVELKEVFTVRKVPRSYRSKEGCGMVGMENLGATCYLNALLQMLFHINSFRDAVYHLPIDADDPSQSTTLALQSLFVQLQTSDKEVSTKELTRAFGWTSAEAFQQQDVQEMMRVLIDKLEEKVAENNKKRNAEAEAEAAEEGTEVAANAPHQTNFIKSMFAGKLKSYIHCTTVDFQSDRLEDFYDIQLDVKNCTNIYDSFAKYVAIEMLDGDNQYYCDAHHGKFDAKKGVIFTHFPPILTIHLKRFDFDMQTMNFMKIHDYFEFPSILYLDDFLEDRAEAEQQDDAPPPAVTPNTYVLHSVLVHSGDVGGGHYYAYIRPANSYNVETVYNIEHVRQKVQACMEGTSADFDASSPDSWFRFNDDSVYKVEDLEAVQNCYGRKKASYWSPTLPTSAAANQEHLRYYDQYNNIVSDRAAERNTVDYESVSFSSAYMLVYIRLEDAMMIMNPCTAIPQPLLDKLAYINKYKRCVARMKALEKSTVVIHYATENTFFECSHIVKAGSMLNHQQFRPLVMAKNSTKMGLVQTIAKELGVIPFLFTLWEVAVFKNGLRITRPVDPQEYLQPLVAAKGDEVVKHYFVQLLYNTSNPRDVKVPHNAHFIDRYTDKMSEMEDDLDELLDTIRPDYDGFQQKVRTAFYDQSDRLTHFVGGWDNDVLLAAVKQYRRLMRDEETWLRELRAKIILIRGVEFEEMKQQLAEQPAGVGSSLMSNALQSDIIFGCGIGLPNEQLEEIKEVDSDIFYDLCRRMQEMDEKLMAVLDDIGHVLDAEEDEEETLFIVKLFDPYNLFRSLNSLHNCRTAFDLQAAAPAGDAVRDSAMLPGMLEHIDGAAVDADINFYVEKHSDEYIAIKHLGLVLMSLKASHTGRDMKRFCSHLLAINHIHLSAALSRLSLEMHIIVDTKLVRVEPTDLMVNHCDPPPNNCFTLIFSLPQAMYEHLAGNHVLPIYAPLLASEEGVKINTNSNLYRHPDDKLNNAVYTMEEVVEYNKTMSLHQEPGVKIYDDRYQHELKDADDISDQQHAGHSRHYDLVDYYKQAAARRECYVLPLERRDMELLVNGHRYYNIHDINHQTASSTTSGQKRSFVQMKSKSRPFNLCAGFSIDFVSNATNVTDIIAAISNRLQIHYAHLCVAIVDEHNMYESILIAEPAHFHSSVNLGQYLKGNRARLLPLPTKIFVYYRILEFNLVSNIILNHRVTARAHDEYLTGKYGSLAYSSLPKQFKHFDVILVDARLRFWHALYLKHIQGLIDDNNAANSETLFKAKPVEVIDLMMDSGDETELEDETLLVKRGKLSTDKVSKGNGLSHKHRNLAIPSADALPINWPHGSHYVNNPYIHRSTKGVSVRQRGIMKFQDLCEELREIIGIPTNVAGIVADKTSALYQSYQHALGDMPPPSGTIDMDAIVEADKCGNVTAITCNLTSESVDLVADALEPHYPLLVCMVEQNIISNVYASNLAIQKASPSWADLGVDSGSGPVAVQTIDAEDFVHMVHSDEPQSPPYSFSGGNFRDWGMKEEGRKPFRGAGAPVVPALLGVGLGLGGSYYDLGTNMGVTAAEASTKAEDSMVLSVFYFTLYGGGCEQCDASHFNGPFLSYVRKSDSYQSLIDRLIRMTGDSDMAKYRLAVVNRKKEPTFITRPSSGTSSTTSSSEGEGSSQWLWEYFVKKYKPNTHVQDRYASSHQKYAWLGIQRSVSDVQNEATGSIHSMRYKPQASNNIRIS